MKMHKDLKVWEKSIKYVENIYKCTADFPKEEMYGLVSQIRRASVSVPSNIAEGATRQSNKEFLQFLFIALGSLSEVDTQLIIAEKLGYIDKSRFDELIEQNNEIARMIQGLIKSKKRRD